ncbi:uncharacterized protein LOC128554339 isoform X2 [Mercenaria mercenaria]|nr:uncharacterized protein LOC128554339 isoform X2 [Mercenaria mercenaria]XP_053391593.1 uncharacterized protein LOC128554339 isoform X2 [Mercenaria mercenaria]XP_053391594.1 uncharacterized protein LOC128554339 isoform X2 [Mercenaria mercenaria]XP_053391595.1 uncharacterized protein LOC128554339 isoform X2 [Mercenaria mercenaria]
MSHSVFMPVKTFKIETLRVFPRVHYFQRRFRDLLPRFKRVIGAFPKGFHVEEELEEINDLDEKFTKKLNVYVIGHSELEIANVVVSTKPFEIEKISDLKEPPSISLFLCYTKTDSLDQTGLKNISSVIDKFFEDFGNGKPHLFEYMFVVIDTVRNHTDEEQDLFQKEVHEVIHSKLQDTDVHTYQDRIIIGSHDTVLGSKISELLETMLVDGFHKVITFLDRFVRKTKQYNSEIDIIHTDLVVRSIQAFLRDDIGLADMRKIAESNTLKETEGVSVDETFLNLLLNKLARLVKCAIVEPCAAKYNIPSWVVNQLLVEIDFEQKLVESVSKNTKHHLRKLNDFCKNFEEILKSYKRKANMGRGKHGASQHEYFTRLVSYKFDFIVYPLQNDMSKVISDAEKTMASAERIITIMGKMIFEIEGYLEQTITEKYEPRTPTADVPKDLRNAILELKDVYSTGTVYDVFEIHVREETTALKEDVSTLMRKYGYTQPYQVKTIKKEPVKMMAERKAYQKPLSR